MGSFIFITCAGLFVLICIGVIFYEWTIEPLLMRLKLGRKKAIASREERAKARDERSAQWAAESTEVSGKYRAMCVKRAKSGRIVASYEIGDLLSINDENFSAKRMDLLTTARLRAEELNSEAL